MKIFNVENGVKKVYVQVNDIIMLTHSYISMPVSIFAAVFDESNGMDFVEFTHPREVEFFESVDWIVDYKQIRDLSEKEIKEKEQKIVNEMNEIANRFNSMTDNEKRDNQSLIRRPEQLDYKMKCLAEILLVKQGHKQMPFPVVPDSDGFSLLVSLAGNNYEYEIRASLDPNKILLFKINRKELSNDDRILQGFLKLYMPIAIMKRNEKDEFFGDYEINNFLTEDSRYFVTEFKVKSYEEQEEVKEEKGRKTLVKRIFGKNRK